MSVFYSFNPQRFRRFCFFTVLTAAMAFPLALMPEAASAQDKAAQPDVTDQGETAKLDEVIVSASRLGVGIPGASTTIISSQDIENSPAQTLPEIIGAEAGVQYRDFFGDRAGAMGVVDIRGFGATATSNTLVLVNGRRLNDIDLAAIDWATIPLDSIDRIEITRGNAGAVLYGDGAVGGTINIVTKSPAVLGKTAKASASYGSYVYRDSKISAANSVGLYSMSAYGSYVNSRGYRMNNRLIQRTLNAQINRKIKDGNAFLKIGLNSEAQGMPGARKVTSSSDLVADDPRGATTPSDKNEYNGISATVGITRELSNNINLIIDGGFRNKDQEAKTVSAFGPQYNTYIDTELVTVSLTPRIEAELALGGMDVNSTLGLDYYYADYNSDRQKTEDGDEIHRYDGKQQSIGLYAQNTIAANAKTDISVGARLQRTNFTAGDRYNAAMTNWSAYNGHRASLKEAEIQYAFNLGIDYRLNKKIAFFGRLARSFRTPTIDERIGSSANYSSFALKTQVSQDAEAGVRLRQGPFEMQSSVFIMRLRDELHYNPDTFINMNFDPTQRTGLENSFVWRILDGLKLKGNISWTRAKFRSGTYSGKEVPLVSDVTAGASLFWDIIKKKLKATATVNYFGKKRMDNDESNFQQQIGNYALVDMKLDGTYRRLNWSAEVNNIFDKSYFNYAIASATTFGTYNAYPLPGRTFMLTAGMDF